jgi:hypothetical protein
VRFDAEVVEVLVELEDVDGGGSGGDGEVPEGRRWAPWEPVAARSRIVARTARCTERSTGISRSPSRDCSTAAIPSGPPLVHLLEECLDSGSQVATRLELRLGDGDPGLLRRHRRRI